MLNYRPLWHAEYDKGWAYTQPDYVAPPRRLYPENPDRARRTDGSPAGYLARYSHCPLPLYESGDGQTADYGVRLEQRNEGRVGNSKAQQTHFTNVLKQEWLETSLLLPSPHFSQGFVARWCRGPAEVEGFVLGISSPL